MRVLAAFVCLRRKHLVRGPFTAGRKLTIVSRRSLCFEVVSLVESESESDPSCLLNVRSLDMLGSRSSGHFHL